MRSIGRAVCHKFVAEGYRVAVADFDHEAGRKVARELGDDALFVACNVRCSLCAQLAISVEALVKQPSQRHMLIQDHIKSLLSYYEGSCDRNQQL